MRKLVKSLFLLSTLLLYGAVFSANIKNLDSNITLSPINQSQVGSTWQDCQDLNSTLKRAHYVGDLVSPGFSYSYSSSNSNWARSFLDTSFIAVYNPGTFENNGSFNLLSNLMPNGSSIKITKPSANVEIVDNNVGRSNMAGLFSLRGNYHTINLGSNNSSNFLGYRLDYNQSTPLYVQKNYSFVNDPVTHYSCAGYYVAKCGDGIVDDINKDGDVNTDGKYGIKVGSEVIQWASGAPEELCDDGDTNGQPGYCNTTCDGYVPVEGVPVCSLDVVDLNNGSYNVNWIITGSFNPTQINLNPALANQTSYPVSTNIGIWNNLVPTSDRTHNLSMTVSNNIGSSTCQATFEVDENLPSCSLDIVQNSNGLYNMQWNIDGTFSSASVNVTPPLVDPSFHSIIENVGTIEDIVPTGYGTLVATMIVTNSAGTVSCQDAFYVAQPDSKVCGDGKIDWPNDDGVYEECDNGPGFGNGCNNQCKLMTPSCVLMANSQYQLVGNPVTFTANTDSWARFYSLNLGDDLFGASNIIYTGDIVFPYQHTYTNVSNYNQVLIVENNHPIIATGVTRPTAVFNQNISVVQGCNIQVDPYVITLGDTAKISWEIGPDFNIPAFIKVTPALVGTWPHNVYYKTGNTYVGPNIVNTGTYTFSINAWTNNGYPFACTGVLYVDVDSVFGELEINKTLLTTGTLLSGDFVDYRIELTNVGSGMFHDAYISDVMPRSLDLVYHDLVGVYPYNTAQWQDIYGDWFFEYSGFDLAPGQTVYLNVRGQVRENASSNNTTNCVYTSGDYDCVMYALASDPYIQKSQKMSNSLISTDFTTGSININTGDYITYRIDFANVGGDKTTGGVRIVDHMPLCVDYVSASIYGVLGANFTQAQDINGRWVLEYNGFDLLAGQNGYIIITGQIMSSSVCDNYNTYTNNSYIYFYNPSVVSSSDTTAIRTEKSIIVLTKDSPSNTHLLGENKTFEIQVQNVGPNIISDIVLEDIWPNSNCISYLSRTGDNRFTKNPTSLVWNYDSNLNPGSYLNLSISGVISNSPSCVNLNYENMINLRYTELGVEYTDSDNHVFSVEAAPLANISLVKTVNKNIVSSGDDLIYTITYKNIGTATLETYSIVDYWPGMVEFISASPFPSNVVNLSTGSVLTWNFYTNLVPGQTGQIQIQGKVR